VIGGGVTLIYALLFYSCPLITSGYNIIGCGAVFYMLGPIYLVGWTIAFFQPIFHYDWIFSEFYAPLVSVVVWFIVGSIIGSLVGFVKKKKSQH